MKMKIEMLIDANDMVRPDDINALLDAVFTANSHLARLIVCDTSLLEPSVKKHEWRFYMNGTFCINCNQPIGTPKPCRG